jgi:hypothetical protein
VNEVFVLSCVGDVDGDGNAFAQAQEGAGDLTVIGCGLDSDATADVECGWRDAEAEVGFVRGFWLCSPSGERERFEASPSREECTCGQQKISSIHHSHLREGTLFVCGTIIYGAINVGIVAMR